MAANVHAGRFRPLVLGVGGRNPGAIGYYFAAILSSSAGLKSWLSSFSSEWVLVSEQTPGWRVTAWMSHAVETTIASPREIARGRQPVARRAYRGIGHRDRAGSARRPNSFPVTPMHTGRRPGGVLVLVNADLDPQYLMSSRDVCGSSSLFLVVVGLRASGSKRGRVSWRTKLERANRGETSEHREVAAAASWVAPRQGRGFADPNQQLRHSRPISQGADQAAARPQLREMRQCARRHSGQRALQQHRGQRFAAP